MGHDREVPAVGGAEGRYSVCRSVGVERVLHGRRTPVVHVADRRKRAGLDLSQDLLFREKRPSFPVGHPDPQGGAFHSLEHDGRAREDPHGRKPGLEPSGQVVDEPRLMLVLDPFPWDPAEKRHQLASVADPEAEGVRPVVEPPELFEDISVELDHSGPPLRGVEHVRVAEPPDERHPPEVVQPDRSFEKVGHGDVPDVESGLVKRGGHLPVAVASFLPQYRDAMLPVLPGGGGSRHGPERDLERRTRPVVDVLLLFGSARRIRLERFDPVARFLPDAAQNPHVLVQYPPAAEPDPYTLPGRGGADDAMRDVILFQPREDPFLVRRKVFDDQAQLLGEQARDRLRGFIAYVQPAVSGERHFEQGGDDPAVAAVVPGKDQVFRQESLDGLEGAFQQGGIRHVGRFVSDLPVRLGESGSPEPVPAASEVDVEEPALSGHLDVRSDHPGDVRAGARRPKSRASRAISRSRRPLPRAPSPPWRGCPSPRRSRSPVPA